MNNMKKIGLSALAGSLVAFSANAVEVSVSGKTEVTYSGVDGVQVTNLVEEMQLHFLDQVMLTV